jgi:AraC family transcriptional regulator
VLGSRPRDCRPATLLVEPAGDRHSNHFAEAADVVVVQPDPRRAELLQPCARLLGSVQCFREPVVALLARRLARELTASDQAASLVIEGLALELIAAAARHAASPIPRAARPAWVRQARERLHDGAHEGVSVADVAAGAGVHPVHLARVFRACFGLSPGEYVRRVRLEHATARLAATTDALADIAHDAGFADQSHFTRAFRQHTGLSPGAFRRLTHG